MSCDIHPSALVDPKAELGEDVKVGPFAVIEANVEIGDGCNIEPAAQILSHTRLGKNNSIGRAAIIGGDPQDLSFSKETVSYLAIGDNNTIREHATIHRGSDAESSTTIGNENYLMATSHVGHNSALGNNNVLANAVLIAGHVEIGDHTFLGGGAAFHQFIHIGTRCIVQGNARISKDIPPYAMVAGYNLLIGMNVVGLRRAGFSTKTRTQLKGMFRRLLQSRANLGEELAVYQDSEADLSPPESELLNFLQNGSGRGFCIARP